MGTRPHGPVCRVERGFTETGERAMSPRRNVALPLLGGYSGPFAPVPSVKPTECPLDLLRELG